MNLCDFLTISGPEFEHVSGKNKSSLISMISNHLQREELRELEDDGMAELLLLMDKIIQCQAVSETTLTENVSQPTEQVNMSQKQDECQQSQANEKNEEQMRLSQEIEALQLRLSLMKRQSECEKPSRGVTTHNRMSAPHTTLSQAPHSWHKDFKISGQIGEPGQKDRLTFSSLARQIEHGLSKGFPEVEKLNAVIRAIAPGMQLRSYLEGKTNLTLPTLRRILRCHYQEKSATDLYKQLSSEVQGAKETPQNVVIRALDLRQKILFASQESESGLKYDPGLVQNMFLHTVLTGLQSDNIKRDLQPYLEQPNVSDELLLEKLNTSCAYENERQDKRRMLTPHRSAAIHSAQTCDSPGEKKEKTTVQQTSSKVKPDILSELKEMRSNMALLNDLKAEVSEIKEFIQKPQCSPSPYTNQVGGPQDNVIQQMTVSYPSQMPPPGQWSLPGYGQRGSHNRYNHMVVPQPAFPTAAPRRRRRCFACQQNNTEDCMHCYGCGSIEHFLAGCRMREARQVRSNPLNGVGSLQRDRE